MLRITFGRVAVLFAALIATAVDPSSASADRNTPIYLAASDYRAAVRTFEQIVLRNPKVRQTVKRLVDQLENSTSNLKTAAHDHDRFSRLCNCYLKTDALHARVELTFFGNLINPPDPAFEAGWIAVSQAYETLSLEIRYLQEIRHSKRGQAVVTIDHTENYFRRQTTGLLNVPVQRYSPYAFNNSQSLDAPYYSSGQYSSGQYRYGTQTDALPPQYGAVQYGPVTASPLATPNGAQLQRNDSRAQPQRIPVSTKSQLKSAVLGAMLQRK